MIFSFENEWATVVVGGVGGLKMLDRVTALWVAMEHIDAYFLVSLHRGKE